MQKQKQVVYKGVKINEHEYDTIRFLEKHGYRIEPIKPISVPKMKNPDLLIDGAIWEVKSPITKNEDTIERKFMKAAKQANRIVFDLRRAKLPEKKALNIIKKNLKSSTKARKVKIITRDGKILDFKK